MASVRASGARASAHVSVLATLDVYPRRPPRMTNRDHIMEVGILSPTPPPAATSPLASLGSLLTPGGTALAEARRISKRLRSELLWMSMNVFVGGPALPRTTAIDLDV